MKRILTFATLAGMLAVAALHGQSTKPAVDLSSIAGDYIVTAASRGGQSAPPAMASRMRVRIADGQITIFEGEAPGPEVATVKRLDAESAPKQIDLMAGRGDGTLVAGVYSIEGDTLSICFVQDGAGPRPTAVADGPDASLLVLKRVVSTTQPTTMP